MYYCILQYTIPTLVISRYESTQWRKSAKPNSYFSIQDLGDDNSKLYTTFSNSRGDYIWESALGWKSPNITLAVLLSPHILKKIPSLNEKTLLTKYLQYRALVVSLVVSPPLIMNVLCQSHNWLNKLRLQIFLICLNYFAVLLNIFAVSSVAWCCEPAGCGPVGCDCR